MNDPTPTRRGPRVSLATQVLIALALGILAGLFFGERTAVLDTVGMAFVRLMQMTVLPYVVVSLISGLGSLRAADAARLAWRVGTILLGLWALGLIFVAIIPMVFPNWEAASFYSPSLAEQPEELPIIDLYFTHNPFSAMANTVVPAVVLFCIALGVALITAPDKDNLLQALKVLAEAFSRIAQFVVRLAPYGVFAIVASTAGTIGLDDVRRIQVYVVTYAAFATVLTFVVLPGLVAALTPVRFSDMVRCLWSALITAFATGSALVVLPLLAEESKKLLQQAELGGEETESSIDVVVPTLFNFPSLGTVLTVAFVLFAGWFVGSPVSVANYPSLLMTGLVSMFGAPTLAIPFLLKMQQLPADMFDLYLAVDVVGSRFGMMLAAMQVATIAILVGCAMGGELRLTPPRFLKFGTVAGGAVASMLLALGVFFNVVLSSDYHGYETFVSMDLASPRVRSEMLESIDTALPDQRPTLERIEQRNRLRVCYRPDTLPFAFVNSDAHLVGYDVALAHELARDLGVALEFAKTDRDEAFAAVMDGRCDIVMNATAVTPDLARRLEFTAPYFEGNMALIVADHRRDEFSTREALLAQESVRIAAPSGAPYYLNRIRARLPNAEVIPIDSPRVFFRAEPGRFDALVYTAEAGAAWTLIYPAYSVVVPRPDTISVPLAYVVRRGDDEWRRYVDVWLELRRRDGTLDQLYDRWILGEQAGGAAARWSIAGDVLGWYD